jgi:hypothetical protein
MGRYRPQISRKALNNQQKSPWTGKPIPKVDWVAIVRMIHDAQERLTETDEEENTAALMTSDLFLVALDEGLTPIERIENLLDGIGKLAFYWMTAKKLSPDLMRRTTVAMTAAISDLASHAKAFNEFANDPRNILRSTTNE